ncbi:MAG: hypothetical protein ABL879_17670, partial [Devosia sp.]
WWQKSNSAKWSDQFYAAMTAADGTDPAAAEKALADLGTQSGGGYPMLAQFRRAALLAHDGKTDEALAAYDALSTNQTDTHLRELALVLASHLLVDKGDVAGVQQRVGGLLGPESTLKNAAQEVLGLTQYKSGDLQAAITTFQSIVDDPLASRELRSRIQLFVSQLIAEGAKLPVAEADVPAADAPAADAPSVDAGTELDVTAPAASSAEVSSSSAPAAN